MLTEENFKTFRAMAFFKNESESLIRLGHSEVQVKEEYEDAFNFLFTKEVRSILDKVELQQWNGTAEKGHWVPKATLPTPKEHPETIAKLYQD